MAKTASLKTETDGLEEAILAAVEALGLLGSEEQAEQSLAKLLRGSVGKPKERAAILDTLRVCARLSAAEPYLRIEAEAKDYAARAKQAAEHAAESRAACIVANLTYQAERTRDRLVQIERGLREKQAEAEQRLREMVGPHAPALALLQNILAQYPVPRGERLPPTAFLSACTLVASLMGTNPVDLDLKFSGNDIKFTPGR